MKKFFVAIYCWMFPIWSEPILVEEGVSKTPFCGGDGAPDPGDPQDMIREEKYRVYKKTNIRNNKVKHFTQIISSREYKRDMTNFY